ncbi:hypothetical protein QFZ20_002332 [Flavobacterium sp. W4I14]|nr:hypothetical protein [Flavobacterium sp. W4I14]
MIIKLIFKVISLLYSAIGTDINNHRAIAFKMKAESNFKQWSEKCSDNPELIIKYFKLNLIILLVLFVFVSSFFINSTHVYVRDFIIIEFFTYLALIMFLKTEDQFIKGTEMFFRGISKYKFFILFSIIVYVSINSLKDINRIDINSLKGQEIINNYLTDAFKYTIFFFLGLYIVFYLLPFILSKIFQYLLRTILIKSHSFSDNTPIKHFLRLTAYFFLICSFINGLVVYFLHIF